VIEDLMEGWTQKVVRNACVKKWKGIIKMDLKRNELIKRTGFIWFSIRIMRSLN
jgi:hypothetical protein